MRKNSLYKHNNSQTSAFWTLILPLSFVLGKLPILHYSILFLIRTKMPASTTKNNVKNNRKTINFYSGPIQNDEISVIFCHLQANATILSSGVVSRGGPLRVSPFYDTNRTTKKPLCLLSLEMFITLEWTKNDLKHLLKHLFRRS